NTIVKPLEEVTKAAEKMASGQLSSRSTKKYDDEIGKLSDTLNSMAEELSHKDELKNEFISSVSHELRTPLTSIKGWAITLNTTDLDDKELLR
ncbi:MAG TPA: two-component sensor histidine kinase, partial [Clostridiaceae bacterium]|nr:two-component sensor histidine kinase [Clostridiaceae bacterium]